IIMDGNRRWAKEHKLAILKGHEYAAKNVLEKIVEYAAKKGVKYLTFWAFSTENWQRNKQEVEGLLNILRWGLKEKVKTFIKKGVRLKVIGDLTKFPQDIQKGIQEAINQTKNGKNITAVLAVNYGGRDEIVRAIEKYQGIKESKNQSVKLTLKEFSQYLDTKDIPDPDLIIRTGGEKRLSGFLLWQSEYSELYFTDTLWPDFKEKDLDLAIEEFTSRQRRFGK
ncbi:di-trans,poly-cis-decaprenylcistransferase, partial [Candidatus Gottesmanbacteria bacterium]|nr:di-trans,poly-cis-decaprenylcistransferase [Candidatus Gottesmanbacteria bacterium]